MTRCEICRKKARYLTERGWGLCEAHSKVPLPSILESKEKWIKRVKKWLEEVKK
jgi:hypothetical protein